MSTYDHRKIEPKWQKYWEDNQTFAAKNKSSDPKLYVLDMFPYPSGAGLHVGHPEGYTATDIYSRQKIMQGHNVLHPMGWDAFGLPAENYAIKTGTHPRTTTENNINTFRRQIKSLGFSYDWSREVNTTDPSYYKWTQWIFLQLWNSWYDPTQQKARPISTLPIPPKIKTPEEKRKYIDSHRLAYEDEAPINWCDACKTGLSNEEVREGVCERCGGTVSHRRIRQWILRITAYADRLLEELSLLSWPEGILEMQRNWIGRSEGAEVNFKIKDTDHSFTVFTTRPDTLFGATYCVLAPEHPLLVILQEKIKNYHEVSIYIKSANQKTDLERTELSKEKTGVRLEGLTAINPLNQEEIPIFVADYVLLSYGTGAIMAVPAHDERDYEFAQKYSLPILPVVKPLQETDSSKCFTSPGLSINSGEFSNLPTNECKTKIIQHLTKNNLGKKTINYRLRDWIFSRQRYWGEPIPLVHCEKCSTVPVPEKDLPLTLPEVERYEPTGTGQSPLANITDWVNTTCPSCGSPAKRETNTMPQWAGSCWYYLRYIDPHNDQSLADKSLLDYWLSPHGVDLYVGGAEHAVLHLLYSRFWHKVLNDLGHIPHKEPFHTLRNQGLILGPDGEKMSKSRGNVINPDEVVEKYGADTLRLYEMFMGPFEAVKPWSESGVEGVHRFLKKLWRLSDSLTDQSPSPELLRLTHQTIQKVTEDIDTFRLNTAISQMMILLNELSSLSSPPRSTYETLLTLLCPFAPHITEEIWSNLGNPAPLSKSAWPNHDPALTISQEVEIAIQVNGRLRGRITLPTNTPESEALSKAKEVENVKKFILDKKIIKEIYIPDKLINFVIK